MARKKATSSNFNEREQLELFVFRADDLAREPVLQDFNNSFSIKFDHVEGISFESQQPDEALLRSFLLTFRQFISHDEPIYLNKIFNVCHKYLTSDELKAHLIKAREGWQKQLKEGQMHFTYNDKEITPEYITDLWINGFYFHNDPRKWRALQSILPHEHLITKHFFLMHLSSATRHVLYVAHIVKIALRENLFSI